MLTVDAVEIVCVCVYVSRGEPGTVNASCRC